MNAYQSALQAFLKKDGVRQVDIAAKIGKPQPTLNRYARGKRFPDADTARAIDSATDGAVPFALWQSVKLAELGIEAAA